jgi:hypothetical protein
VIELVASAFLEASIDREWAVQRPSRSVHSAVIRRSAEIPAHARAFADCVSDRESSGSYTARNPTSSAQGRWQFLDISWRQNGGLHYMVAARLKEQGLPSSAAADVRRFLADTPIYRWPGPYQDTAFVAVILSGGWHHWQGPGCNHLAP